MKRDAIPGTRSILNASLIRTINESGERSERLRPTDMAATSWDYGWQWRAACRGEDAALFFAPNHPESKEERLAREREARAICAICPVRMECLEYAVRIREPHGIWGGLNELERRYLIRDRERREHLHSV